MRTTVALIAAILGTIPQSTAQSMSPLRGEVVSLTDRAAFRVHPINPYDHPIDVEIGVYDHRFYPVEAVISPKRFRLARGATRNVTVVVPFDGQPQRAIRICTESIPHPHQQTLIRAQVCGRFIASRR